MGDVAYRMFRSLAPGIKFAEIRVSGTFHRGLCITKPLVVLGFILCLGSGRF